jgi:NAD(P)-dependent dehydrogenase (short-subunit alcohol dehydrogenase family)
MPGMVEGKVAIVTGAGRRVALLVAASLAIIKRRGGRRSGERRRQKDRDKILPGSCRDRPDRPSSRNRAA